MLLVEGDPVPSSYSDMVIIMEIGDIKRSKNWGEYKLVARSGSGRKRRYTVEFLETGYSIEVNESTFYSGEIKDRFSPSVFGKGYLGTTNISNKSPLYSIWSSMLYMCYGNKCKSFRYRGSVGYSVSERWLNLTNFVEDIKLIEGYDYELLRRNKLYLTIKEGEKVFSVDNCLLDRKLPVGGYNALQRYRESISRARVEA